MNTAVDAASPSHIGSVAPRLSVSTWSLHRVIGITYPDAPGMNHPEGHHAEAETYGVGSLSLLEVPKTIAGMGIQTLEICHFHLPGHDETYLEKLHAALGEAGVELFSLLIDEGDFTHPENATRDLDWIGNWIDTAAALGAQCVRVIAGKQQPSDETLALSRQGFQQLATRASTHGIRVMTENWFSTLSRPEYVLRLLDELEGSVGLCLDFGNWGGPTKYEDLAAIAPRAESCHTKAQFPAAGALDQEDYKRCLDITREAGFSGPYTLIYDGPGDDEFEGLRLESAVVEPYLR
ncbi:MAG: sugar phosphate isomerase/epimerase [Abitibacteriaceae bacterium]|nr:sugar phosphate isomerase/epimerase [Abditibacteriaceae bacterium]